MGSAVGGVQGQEVEDHVMGSETEKRFVTFLHGERF